MEEFYFAEDRPIDLSVANFIEQMQFSDDARVFLLKKLNLEIEHAQKNANGKKVIFKSLTEISEPDATMKTFIEQLKEKEKEFYTDDKTFQKTIDFLKLIKPKMQCKIIAKFLENNEQGLNDVKYFLTLKLKLWRKELLENANKELTSAQKLAKISEESEPEQKKCTSCLCKKTKKKKKNITLVRDSSRQAIQNFKIKEKAINDRYYRTIGNVNAYLASERPLDLYSTENESENFCDTYIQSIVNRLLKSSHYLPDFVALQNLGTTMSQI
jgi:hypothetical protein